MGAETLVYVKIAKTVTEVIEVIALTTADAMEQAREAGYEPLEASYDEEYFDEQ